MKEHLRIEDPERARVLTDIKTTRLLLPFIKRPCSLSDAAHELGVKLPMLSYHVKRFVELGILEVTRTERRQGRGVKLYGSAAKTLSVPFSATPSETLERLLVDLTYPDTRRFQRELARALQGLTPDWGVYITCTESEAVSFSLRPDSGTLEENVAFTDGLLDSHEPAIVANSGRIDLDFDTAKAFQRELTELYERYTKLQNKKGQPYVYQLGLTPAQDSSLE